MGIIGLVGVLDLGAPGGLDDEEDDEEDDEAAGADFLAAAASASRELVRGAVGGFMRTLWALGGMLAVGRMFLCGLIFFWDGGREGEMYVRALGGEMGGRCLWVQYYYLLVRTKDLWSSYQNRRMRRYVRNERTLSLSYLPLYLKGLMDVSRMCRVVTG